MHHLSRPSLFSKYVICWPSFFTVGGDSEFRLHPIDAADALAHCPLNPKPYPVNHPLPQDLPIAATRHPSPLLDK